MRSFRFPALAPAPACWHFRVMITRSHVSQSASSTAAYSECDRYRYALTRIWDPGGRRVNFVMLNPSKATELSNDPTVERCERRARTLGYGGFAVTNLFAWRETDPKRLRAAAHPIGPENDAQLKARALWADDIIAAWGAHGDHLARGEEVRRILLETERPLFHLGLTKAGHPRHPLYLKYAVTPQSWRPH